MSNIIQQLEAEQQAKNVPHFTPGDTIIVQVKVIEGNRERLQAFEGVVIAKNGRSAFTVRKISHGVGVERVFQTDSKQIESITVKRRGRVRRAKLYYMRDRSGKSARIAEDLRKSRNNFQEVAKEPAAKKSEDISTSAAKTEQQPAPETKADEKADTDKE